MHDHRLTVDISKAIFAHEINLCCSQIGKSLWLRYPYLMYGEVDTGIGGIMFNHLKSAEVGKETVKINECKLSH